MSIGKRKRQQIFDKYQKNLNFLIDNKFIENNKDSYLCPICLTPHSSIDSMNPLTLEDAPPKSLGGKANTLTCKRCNNTCGHKIDFHLTEHLRTLDGANFIPNTEMKVQVKIGNETLQGKIVVEGDGTIKMLHSRKNNHPIKLEEKMNELKKNMVIDLNFLKSRIIPENLEYALLKTGYLLAFEKFGYSLIMNDCYKVIRSQLLKPEKRLYPTGFWFVPPYPKELSGVYFVCNKGLECLLSMFNLNTGNSERMYGTLLPLPINSIDRVINNLNMKLDQEKEFNLQLYPFEQTESDYLFDKENIQAMYKWIKERV